MHVLVTGSSGLIGGEAVSYFDAMGFRVTGVDNNMRADFFGPQGDTTGNRARLERACKHFTHREMDIRDRAGVDALFKDGGFELVIHAAAQPSHDLAAKRPFDDFDVNAVGTLNLLEACRRHTPEAVFIFMSTNKVYGDGPNHVPLKELETRWEYADPKYEHGIAEDFSIDRCLHSLFGASKVAADVIAQEYGRYFGMKTGTFRGGCLTGPGHSGAELHGFLSYLMKCAITGTHYTVFGYQGKQVRDNIHCADLVSAFEHFYKKPREGEVYNIGGSRHSNCSMLEAIGMCEQIAGRKMSWSYSETNRIGDHIWWISDVRRFQQHYPKWKFQFTLHETLVQIHDEMVRRGVAAAKA
jgi:CDP-paratose 2-epimerase